LTPGRPLLSLENIYQQKERERMKIAHHHGVHTNKDKTLS
jgi:hypothetical protein